VTKGIDPTLVKVAIGFVGLRSRINMGKIECLLDDSQPRRTAFETFSRRVRTVLDWKKDTNLLFQKLLETQNGNVLWRSVVEQYRLEL
jgi:hypothetical protein